MGINKYWGVAAMIALLVAPLKSADLEFIVREENTQNPLNQSTVILESLNSDYYRIQDTENSNSTTFGNVPDDEILDYTIFHNGHHPFENGTVYSGSNQTITKTLQPYEEWEWPAYNVFGPDGLAISFVSSDEDIYYDSGDDLNYFLFIYNFSGNPINMSNTQIDAGVFDENNNPVMIGEAVWGSPNDELTFDVTFNPYVGSLSYDVVGNNVEACISDASDVTFNGQTYELGPGEVVCQNITTNDNVVPEGINGRYHVNINIGDLNFASRDFYVGPVSTKPEPGKLEKMAYSGSPNPTNGWFKISNSQNKKVNIYNFKGEEIPFERSGENFYINSSGGYILKIGDEDGEKIIKQTIIK